VPDPRPYYQQADIFVLASHQEPFGLVLTEARQAGCAVVATDVGGIPEALDGGEAGILVPPHRADFLGSVLIRLLEAPGELDRLRRRARHDLERFTVSRASAQTLDVYRELHNATDSGSGAAYGNMDWLVRGTRTRLGRRER